jgi:hypothetical protein
MSEQGPEPAVVLTRAACSAKAALGPTAWVVLEELVLGAELSSDGRLVVTTSVRRLGAVLRLDKDTVARALARLGADGFVIRCAAERPVNASCYVVASISGLARVGVDVDVATAADPVLPDTAVRPSGGDRPRRPEVGDGARPRRSRRVPGADGGPAPRAGQLSLLADDAAPNDATTATSSPITDLLIPASDTTTNPTQSKLDTELEDDHHKSYASSPIRRTDSCHPSGEGAGAPFGRHRGGGAHPC